MYVAVVESGYYEEFTTNILYVGAYELIAIGCIKDKISLYDHGNAYGYVQVWEQGNCIKVIEVYDMGKFIIKENDC